MQSYNNYVNQGGYKTWKGSGINKNPIGYAPGHIRPLTNKDSGNVFPAPFGKPRPLKQYRKGNRLHPLLLVQAETNVSESTPTILEFEKDRIEYNVNRFVKSSLGTALGQGRNGGGLLSELMDKPGAYSLKENDPFEAEEAKKTEECQGVKVVSSYYPNFFYRTENPIPNVENPKFCCNEERKARRRVVYATTNLPVTYYTTHAQYMQNRCQTFDQKSFNFLPPTKEERLANTYLANCQPNAEIQTASEIDVILFIADSFYSTGEISEYEFETLKKFLSLSKAYEYIQSIDISNTLCKQLDIFFLNRSNLGYKDVFTRVNGGGNGCKRTVYKPNNSQFAVQGAVESSTKNLQLNVSTIQSNAASFRFNNNVFLKNKECAASSSRHPYPYQNQRACCYKSFPSYATPNVQPSPYRYYYSPIYSSNHFAQSPKVGLYLSNPSANKSLV
jgi:hypothetical protein